MAAQDDCNAAAPATPEAADRDDRILGRLMRLPTPVGLVMMAAGVVVMPLPGPFGTPLIVCGGLVVAPRVFGKINEVGKRRFPKVRQQALAIVERFLDDMEKRYPSHEPAEAPPH